MVLDKKPRDETKKKYTNTGPEYLVYSTRYVYGTKKLPVRQYYPLPSGRPVGRPAPHSPAPLHGPPTFFHPIGAHGTRSAPAARQTRAAPCLPPRRPRSRARQSVSLRSRASRRLVVRAAAVVVIVVVVTHRAQTPPRWSPQYACFIRRTVLARAFYRAGRRRCTSSACRVISFAVSTYPLRSTVVAATP